MPSLRAYHLLPLGLDALPRLLELDRLCFGGYWTEAGFREELQRPPRDPAQPDRASSVILGAYDLGADLSLADPASLRPSPDPKGWANLKGFAAMWMLGQEGHIITLGVHPAQRRQGLGRQLIEGLLAIAQTEALGWATLEVRVSNLPARRLYQQLGFKVVGERPHYYQDPDEAAVILWKRLS